MNKLKMKQILHVILFTFLAMCIVVGLGALFIPKGNLKNDGLKFSRARGFYGEPKNSIQVLGIGNSDLYYAINPLWMYQSYGFTSFMAGEPLQNMIDANDILDEALKNQKPKVVVLETSEFFLRKGDFELDNAFSSFLKKYFPVLEYHMRWKTLHKKDFTLSQKRTYKPTVMKGFKYSLRRGKVLNKPYMNQSLYTDSMDPIDSYYLDKIMNTCKKKGIKVVFTTMPSSADWNMKRHDFSQKMANKYHVSYYDFNLNKYQKQIGFNMETDFKDKGNHMNLLGARKVTRWLGDYLSTTYKLKNVSNDPKYASWNKDVKIFHQRILKKVLQGDSDIYEQIIENE